VAEDPSLVLLVGEMGAQRAASVLGGIGIDAAATLAIDAGPRRGEPREVAAEELLALNEASKKNKG
jgi:hypothetical protein